MALQETVIPISFAQGLDTKTDKKQIAAGSLLSLQNGVFINPREIVKRNGYASFSSSVSTGTTISSGNSLGVLNNNLQLMDGLNFYSYLPDLDKWTGNGVKTAARISTDNLVGLADQGIYPSTATIGDYKLVISGGANIVAQYSYLDTSTNTPIQNYSGLFINPGYGINNVRVVAFNNEFVLFVTGTSGGNFVTTMYTLPPTPGASPSSWGTLNSATNYAPITALASTTNLYVLYTNTSGELTLDSYNTSLTLVNTAAVYGFGDNALPYRNGADLAYDPINNQIMVMWTDPSPTLTGSVHAVLYSSTLTALQTVYNSSTGGGGQITGTFNGTSFGLFYEVRISLPLTPSSSILVSSTTYNLPNFYIQQTLITNYATSPTVAQQVGFAGNTFLYSQPLIYNGDYYYTVIHNETVQPIQFIVRFSGNGLTYNVVAKFALDTAMLSQNIGNNTAPLSIVSWNGNSLPYLNAAQTFIVAGVIGAQYIVNEMDLTFDEKLSNTPLADNLTIVGGVVSLFDGNGIAESGFQLFPTILNATIFAPGSTSTYSYTAIYTWVDETGNLHRSAPAFPVTLSVMNIIQSGSGVTLKVTSLGLSELYKAQNVTVNLYRTTNGGTTFYLINQSPSDYVAFSNQSFVDAAPDTSIIGNQQLYTTGGEVENISPPATSLMTEFKNRIVLVDSENPLQWWFSKQVIQGAPVEFSDILTQNIDQKGGNISALSTMDDKLIFFKTSNIWYVIGDGPSPNGLNNDFSYPQIISSDTGCVNQSSIVLSPTGLFFQSPKGIYLLGRDLSLNYVGAPVEQFNSAIVTSAQMISGTNQIRFSLSTGIVLVYDYFVKQWSTFTNIPAVDAVIYAGNYTYLTSAGITNTETPNVYADPLATPISLSLTTGWLSFAGLQNFQRVKQLLILGESESPTTLSVSLAYNFNSTITQVDNIAMTGSQQPMQYRIFTQLQKCETIQISLSDAPTTTTEGLRLSALAFNIAQKKGPFKMPASATYG